VPFRFALMWASPPTPGAEVLEAEHMVSLWPCSHAPTIRRVQIINEYSFINRALSLHERGDLPPARLDPDGNSWVLIPMG
jgi:hypothetical protein